MYMYQKLLLKWKIFFFSFMTTFGQRLCIETLANFGADLKIHKKSNFDRNQLKPYT